MKKTFLSQLLEMDMDMDMMGSNGRNGRNGRNGELDVDVDVDMEDDKEKKYADEEHAREHAKEFIDRAKEVLNYNKKPAENGEVADMAMKFAKDYHDTIVDEINKMKYNGKEDKVGRPERPERPDMGADDAMMGM